MNFKIRTYKKAGIEKGNLESELFYDTAEETQRKHVHSHSRTAVTIKAIPFFF